MNDFVGHYNNDHQYESFRFATPYQAYSGEHIELLAKGREVVGKSNVKLHLNGDYRVSAETGNLSQRCPIIHRNKSVGG
ncbi:hypothetical protein [Acidithrix sp. C25]|uniref:hypothetical protein n=1 Tax=Acidithrix sp. C25 TaxID=1671482 RepID=UPI00191BB6A8|nr:hypothetical protein [Acidithrix sp. C25]CAG4909970.1 unnamed protein product [Acidithrix sp. C25]